MEEKAPFGVIIREFIIRNALFVGVIIVGLLLCLVGVFQYLGTKDKKEEIKFVSGIEEVKGVETKPIKISVDVAGKVQKPGVYTLDEGARLQDALTAAGGLATSADREYVSKRLNLAQKINDGAKIYIPYVGELEEKVTSSETNSFVETVSVNSSESNSSLIDINSASTESLDTLPKIGPVTANKIINGRPYRSIEELVSKKVLTQKTFDGLKELIVSN